MVHHHALTLLLVRLEHANIPLHRVEVLKFTKAFAQSVFELSYILDIARGELAKPVHDAVNEFSFLYLLFIQLIEDSLACSLAILPEALVDIARACELLFAVPIGLV